MASVQELIEGLLDEKLAALMAETKRVSRTVEAEKWRLRCAVLSLASMLAFTLLFVYGYRADHELNRAAYGRCVERNAKEQAILRIINVVVNNGVTDTRNLTPEEVQQRANDREVFLAAREEYSKPSDCESFR